MEAEHTITPVLLRDLAAKVIGIQQREAYLGGSTGRMHVITRAVGTVLDPVHARGQTW